MSMRVYPVILLCFVLSISCSSAPRIIQGDIDSQFAAARYYLEQKNYTKALIILDRIDPGEDLSDTKQKVMEMQAEGFMALGKYLQAGALYYDLIMYEPRKIAYHSKYGICMARITETLYTGKKQHRENLIRGYQEACIAYDRLQSGNRDDILTMAQCAYRLSQQYAADNQPDMARMWQAEACRNRDRLGMTSHTLALPDTEKTVWMGIRLKETPIEGTLSNSILVDYVEPGSEAEAAGIAEGHKLIKMNDFGLAAIGTLMLQYTWRDESKPVILTFENPVGVEIEFEIPAFAHVLEEPEKTEK